jgi:hypothetical protein
LKLLFDFFFSIIGIISECKPLLNKTLITNQTTESSSIEADLLIKINSSNKLNSRKKNIFNNTNRIIESKQINLFDYNIMEYIDLKSKTIISTLNNYFIESNELTTTTTATTTTKQMTSALNTTTLSIPFIQGIF